MSLPISISVEKMRADIVFDEVAANIGRVLIIDDVRRLPRFAGWSANTLETAIADLVHDGRLFDDEHGRVGIRPWRGAS